MVEQGWAFYPMESLQIHNLPRQRVGFPGKAFIHMKYVVETMVSMFRLKCLVEYSAMGNPKLIHILTVHMKGGFPVLLEKKKFDW